MRKLVIFTVVAISLFLLFQKQIENGRFQLYLDNHKDYVGVEFLQYFAGWVRYSQSNYASVIFRFNKFRKLYPESKYSEDVMYMLGNAYAELYQRKEAKQVFNEFLVRFKNSKRSQIVVKKLQFMYN